MNNNHMSVFQTPISQYENTDLLSDLKKHISSREQKGVESNVTPNFKHNIHESKFDFFRSDAPIIKDTMNWLTNCIEKTVNFINNEDVGYKINFNDSWYHVTKTNGTHESHVHANCSWCGIYYVEVGNVDEGGKTIFENPTQPMHIDHGNIFLAYTSRFEVIPKNGLLILFPSYLKHFQSLYTGNKDRIVVAFNSAVHQMEKTQ